MLLRYWSAHLASAFVLVTALIALAARLVLQPTPQTGAEQGWLILGYIVSTAALFVAPAVTVLRPCLLAWTSESRPVRVPCFWRSRRRCCGANCAPSRVSAACGWHR